MLKVTGSAVVVAGASLEEASAAGTSGVAGVLVEEALQAHSANTMTAARREAMSFFMFFLPFILNFFLNFVAYLLVNCK